MQFPAANATFSETSANSPHFSPLSTKASRTSTPKKFLSRNRLAIANGNLPPPHPTSIVNGFDISLKITSQLGVSDGLQNFCDSGFTCCRHLTPFAAPTFIASFKLSEANGESSAINRCPCSSWYPVIGVPYARVCFGAGVGPFVFAFSLPLLSFSFSFSSSSSPFVADVDARAATRSPTHSSFFVCCARTKTPPPRSVFAMAFDDDDDDCCCCC